jgi:hypothetical protein
VHCVGKIQTLICICVLLTVVTVLLPSIDEAKTATFKDPVRTEIKSVYNTFHLGYKNRSVYAVGATIRCLSSDK